MDGGGFGEGEVVNDARSRMCPAQFNQFEQVADLLGVPSYKASQTMLRSRDTWDLWEMWDGYNQLLSNFVNRDFLATGGWVTKLFPRKDFTEGMRGKLISYVFEPQVLDEIAENAPNPVLEGHIQTREWAMQFRGTSFEMNTDFVFSPVGLGIFGEKCKQMEMSLDNSLSYDVFDSIYEAGHIQRLRTFAKKPMPEPEFVRVLQDIANTFGAFQKSVGGHDKIEARGVEILSNQHVIPTDSIDPCSSSVRYVTNTDRRRTTFAVGGPAIANKGIDTDQHEIISRATDHPVKARACRAFKMHRDLPISNPAFTRRTVGEWYFAGDLVTGKRNIKDYRTSYRALTIGDAANQKRSISLHEMLTHCGLFNTDGDGGLSKTGEKLIEKILEYSPIKSQTTSRIVGHSEHFVGRKHPRDGDAAPAANVSLHALYTHANWFDQVTSHLEELKGDPDPDLKKPLNPKAAQLEALVNERNGELLTLKNVEDLMSYNIPIPFNFLLFRPYIVFEAGSYVLLRGGAETGVLYTNRVQIEFNRMAKQRKIGVHLNFAAKTVILDQGERNIALFADVYISKYHGGYDTDLVQGSSSDYENSLAHSTTLKSVYVAVVPVNFAPSKPYIDISGYVNSQLLQKRSAQIPPMYPTAPVYVSLYGWCQEGTDFLQLDQVRKQGILDNTLTLRGWSKLHYPVEWELGDDKNENLGCGHLGKRFTCKTIPVFNGEEDSLEEHVVHIA
jgi:hypothetical protein